MEKIEELEAGMNKVVRMLNETMSLLHLHGERIDRNARVLGEHIAKE